MTRHATTATRSSAAMAIAFLAAALTAAPSWALAPPPEPLQGRPLVDALRVLQSRGLRIVFTSATVSADLVVKSEPRATTARLQLDEILAPHALMAREGPGGILQIVRAKTPPPDSLAAPRGAIEGRILDAATGAALTAAVRVEGIKEATRTDSEGRFRVINVLTGTRTLQVSAPGYIPATQVIEVDRDVTAAVTLSLAAVTPQHNEYVSVVTAVPFRKDRGVPSEMSFDRRQMVRLNGSLADDPVRLVHALPRAMAVDDFRSEFSVRGSPSRHVNVVVDGVSTQWLQHTAPGRGATGSLTVFATDVVEDVTLRAGAYPRRFGDYLGPQLDLTLREGSRADFKLRGGVGGTTGALLGEGPIGRSARGSWLVAARQSYLEWPTEKADSTRTAFGFSDAITRIVYDVRPSQQVALTWLGGRSNIDGDDEAAVTELGDGTNRLSAASLAWRSALGSAGAIQQRAYLVRHDFANRYQTGDSSDHGRQEQLGYRIDFNRAIARGVIEAGAEIVRSAIDDVPRVAHAMNGHSWRRSAHAHFVWAATSALTFSPGAGVNASNLSPDAVVSRWLQGEWTFRPGWTLNGSAGVSHQLPELRQVLATEEPLALRPERAVHFDIAVEQRLMNSVRWQATLFSRNEADVLREPEIHPRLVDGVLVAPYRYYVNALQATARGVELLLERRSDSGFSGWAAYSYGRVRTTDITRGERFWGDFDRRHMLTLFGRHNLSPRTGVGATLRAASNLPIPAYLDIRDGTLAVAAERNRVRLPMYARLDVRADRQFEYLGRRLTLFVELLNVLNRANAGLANGSIDPASGRARDFTDSLFRRRASVGAVIEF